MKIKVLFSKNIDRQINPAVVVSKQDSATVKIEIDEYVFTQTITENLYKYLNTLVNSKQDKTGIWINGFYGSGKSHFIKYIYYILSHKHSDKAFEHYIEEVKNNSSSLSDATPSNINLLQKKISKMDVDTIIFNIDAVSGQKNDKEKITKIFFNQFNSFRGYNSVNIALALLLEKQLDKQGLFKKFKKRIEEQLKENWDEKSHLLASIKQSKVLSLAKELDPSLDTDSLAAKLKNPDDITIADHLIPEFVEYLNTKDDNYRLIFLIDEISQYVGTNTSLLLNLQTIIEEIGSQCENKIWLSTTAQQTIEDLVENTENKGEDFGKILGRFETRISLESQNTTYITQKRILDKKSEAIGVLSEFYKKNKEHIENQFVFSHEFYKGFNSKEEFVLSYPFVPYQFKLISDVFENFANLGYVIKEVKDNERSILGITHSTAKDYKDIEVGKFVTFDAFFNEQMKSNITHHASRILDPALQIEEIQKDDFAKKVVYILFMISNITDTKKLTFPPNLDNLLLLLLDDADVNRLELQNRVQAVLDILIDKTIIYKEDDLYNFFKEEEIDVAKQINNQNISLEDRLTAFDSDVFSIILGFNRKVGFGNNNFNLALKIDDKEIIRNGDFEIIISVYDSAPAPNKALNVNKSDLVCCVNEWFNKDNSLRREFDQFVKTRKFFKLNSDSAAGSRKKAISKFGEQNEKKIDDIRRRIIEKFSSTSFISNNQVLSSSEIQGSSPKEKFENAIDYHLREIYKKNHLANGYAKLNDDLRKAAEDIQINGDTSLTEAESLVNSYINNFGDSITVDDVVKQFLKAPYGWKDISTLDMLVKLFKKNRRKFEWRSDFIDIKSFVDKAIKSNERAAIVIRAEDIIDPDNIRKARKAYRDTFNEDLKEDSDQAILCSEIKAKIKTKVERHQSLSDSYFGKYPFGKHFNDYVKILNKILDIRDPKTLFVYLTKFADDNKIIRDNCIELEDFIANQFTKYDAIRDFTQDNLNNFDALEEADREKSLLLRKYFKDNDKPADSFPQMNKIHQELAASLNNLVGSLKTKALGLYDQLYSELDAKAKELKVNEPGIYDSKEYKINAIENSNNIETLRRVLSEVNDFKAKNLKAIIEYAGKNNGGNGRSTEIISDLSTTIENEEQLNNYINELKKRLLAKLKENKIIIIK